VRRQLSIVCLLLAWLCANGVTWNAVQVVAWIKMYHDNAQVMSAAAALEATFDGRAPCDLCQIARSAEDTAQQQLPQDSLGSHSDKFVLVCQQPAPVLLTHPDFSWPGAEPSVGLVRTEAVPVPPPRV